MNLFRSVVFIAALAGLVAGLAMTGLQAAFTVPLILQAEVFEGAAEHGHDAAAPAHEHEEEGWSPADGAERLAFTALANVVTGVGFALLLVVASELAGGLVGWRKGLIWGLAGFAIFTLAPGLGLPPELPAMPAADITARQVWWVLTASATAAGLALIAFRPSALLAALGIVLLVFPHLVGAPQPPSHETPIPPDLLHRFVVAVTMTNLVFWAVLGVLVGLFRPRFGKGLAPPQGSLA